MASSVEAYRLKCLWNHHCPHAYCVSHPSIPPWFILPNYIRWREQFINSLNLLLPLFISFLLGPNVLSTLFLSPSIYAIPSRWKTEFHAHTLICKFPTFYSFFQGHLLWVWGSHSFLIASQRVCIALIELCCLFQPPLANICVSWRAPFLGIHKGRITLPLSNFEEFTVYCVSKARMNVT